jgi:tellurite resistance protein TehA-like permease
MFERREDGLLHPKAWTRSRPPRPSSARFWTWPFAVGIAAMLLAVVLAELGLRELAGPLWWFGAAWAFAVALVDIRRWWQNVRWLHSPPTQPAPEDWS